MFKKDQAKLKFIQKMNYSVLEISMSIKITSSINLFKNYDHYFLGIS